MVSAYNHSLGRAKDRTNTDTQTEQAQRFTNPLRRGCVRSDWAEYPVVSSEGHSTERGIEMKVRGNALSPKLQAEVLSAFIYRLTRDNPKGLATQPDVAESCIFASDADWLEHTFFEVTK